MRTFLRLITVFLSISLPGAAPAQNIRPVTPGKIEFGRLQEGRTVEGDIRFTNAGKAPVQIQRVQASCGCTTTKIEKMKVEPGDTASVHYAVRTLGFRGLVRKTITVYFTDPNEKDLEFVIEGTLFGELEVTPSFVDFQGVALDMNSSLTQNIKVQNQSGKPVRLSVIRATSELLTVSPGSATIPAGQSLTVQVTLRPSRAATEDADVWIDSDSASRPKIAVPVFIQIDRKK
jgi:hypothetical protein